MRPGAIALCVLFAAPALAVEANGFVNSRTQASRPRIDGLLSPRDVPLYQETLELNAQVRQQYVERGFVSGDVSAFFQAGGTFRDADANGMEIAVPDHDVPGTRPAFSLNELYVSHEVVPELSLLLGKKRVVWGPGFAFNPTDLINPLKDPTDPSLQRAGAYMARVEIPLATSAFSLLFTPEVTAETNGLPQRILFYPPWNELDDQAHYLVAARAYALISDTDVNFMLFFSNRFRDAFENKLRAGFSVSRVFDATELHVEAILQAGSARQYPNSECLRDAAAAFACIVHGTRLFEQSALDSATPTARILAGARWQGPTETLLSAEYLFLGDGYSPTQFQDVVSGLTLLREAQRRGFDTSGLGTPGTAVNAGATRFAFDPLGRHYLFLTLQQPKIRNDFTLTLTLISSLQDLSGLFAPSFQWAATDWLQLTLSALLPYAGPDALAAVRPDTGAHVSEYSLVPVKGRVLFELRAFY